MTIDIAAEAKRLRAVMDKFDCVNIFVSEGAGVESIVAEMQAKGQEVPRDAFGHVNNATYLVYAQEARFAWSKMLEMVVARAEVDFIAPIYTGDIYIDVEIWVNKIGNSSFGVTYEMKDGDELLARVKTVQVTVSMDTKKSRPINDAERDFLNKYLEEEK